MLKPPRDPTEDYPLIRRAQAGDIAARNQLIEKHMGFLYSMILKHLPDVEPDEYIGACVIKFEYVIGLFDCARGTSLLTYAHRAIFEALMEEIRTNRMIRVPRRNAHISDRSREMGNRASKCRLVGEHADWQLVDSDNDPASIFAKQSEIDDAMEAVAELPPSVSSTIIRRVNGMTSARIAALDRRTPQCISLRELDGLRKVRDRLDNISETRLLATA